MDEHFMLESYTSFSDYILLLNWSKFFFWKARYLAKKLAQLKIIIIQDYFGKEMIKLLERESGTLETSKDILVSSSQLSMEPDNSKQ